MSGGLMSGGLMSGGLMSGGLKSYDRAALTYRMLLNSIDSKFVSNMFFGYFAIHVMLMLI